MFIIFNKDKILSYLISVSTVAVLFVMSFAITRNNNEILKTSTNVIQNEVSTNQVNSKTVEDTSSSINNSIENKVNSTYNATMD